MSHQMKHQIVKIGSACLFDEAGRIDYPVLATKAREIIDYDQKHGTSTSLVVSGAVALGRRILGESESEKPMDMQRQAGVGQLELMKRYAELFANYSRHVVPMLLTYNDLEHHPEDICRSVRNHTESGLYVIVNYNDATDFREVMYDNDKLAAELLTYCGSEQLIVLMREYNGIMDRKNVIPVIEDTSQFMHCDNGGSSGYGRGGFTKKMEAGNMVIEAGARMIAGNVKSSLEGLVDGSCERTEFRQKH